MARFAPPGQILNGMHLYATGEGSPAVVLDSALGGTCLTWTHVQPAVARFTRACSFDRAGFGWSAPSRTPRTSANMVEELRGLLREAGVDPPYILVGHSFGALNARTYYARYPHEVAGLVFVDPAHPEEWLHMSAYNRDRLEKGITLTRRGAWLARLGVARAVAALASTRAVNYARAAVKWVTGGTITQQTGDMILSPIARLPRELYPVFKWMWVQPKFFDTLAGQMQSIVESARQAAEATSFGDTPLIVLGAPDSDSARDPLHRRAATLSTQGKFTLAARSGHWIPMDQPELVVDAVREVFLAARTYERT